MGKKFGSYLGASGSNDLVTISLTCFFALPHHVNELQTSQWQTAKDKRWPEQMYQAEIGSF